MTHHTETEPAERKNVSRLKGRTESGIGFAIRWELVWQSVSSVLERELEGGRGVLWLPVLFGLGIVLYFNLPVEPSVAVMLATAAVLAFSAWRWRQSLVSYRLLLVAAAVVAGVGWMTLRTAMVTAPVLGKEMVVELDGWVVGREAASRGGIRTLIQPVSMGSIGADRMPRYVRVTIMSKPDSVAVGDSVHVLARLRPPSGPTHPGGYDFALADFFKQVGAVGFAYGAATPVDLGEPRFRVRLVLPISHLRRTIRERVLDALPGDKGQIAAALIMGDRRGIPVEIQEVMRQSGLGHVLAISGLHMALVSGSAFWLIRALLALSPGLALRRPIRKWAAFGALGVAAFYLSISGMSVSTQRAFIMMAVMLVAILMGRRALTVRNVALSAMVVLLMEPESVLSAGFQMSFAATLALVAGYEVLQAKSEGRILSWTGNKGPHDIGRRIWIGAVGLATTSLIAGLATTPFAVYHFHRAAPLTLIANLAAMPMVGIVVMPMALFAVLAMPFGLEAIPLTVMGWGLDWIITVARTVSAWSDGWGGVSAFPASALAILTIGFLWFCLWSERWRWGGIVALPVSVVLIISADRPDIFIDPGGETVAVRSETGRLVVIGAMENRFVVENWLRADADTRTVSDKLQDGARCDDVGCVVEAPLVGLIAIASDPSALGDDCRMAQIVVAKFAVSENCRGPAYVIDGIKLNQGGAHAITIAGDGTISTETAYPMHNRRPFMPPAM